MGLYTVMSDVSYCHVALVPGKEPGASIFQVPLELGLMPKMLPGSPRPHAGLRVPSNALHPRHLQVG
jgi:hypothetical protein